MTKLKQVDGRQMVNFLIKRGFTLVRQKGSHVFMTNKDGVKEVVPVHAGKQLPRGLILKILKNTGIEKEDYQKRI
ncbi:MAG: type II toxin-antitoxin system HicA family toxin [Candidatus Altiarchaeota archaeon]|nr:type II toxin-antitoxin system HicA family toxin [Candidatus Altiarchaeota archaeon]